MAHRTTLEEDHPARTSKAAKKPAAVNSTKTASNGDRKSTRLNSSHLVISYAVFCLKTKTLEKLHSYTRTHILPRKNRVLTFGTPRTSTPHFTLPSRCVDLFQNKLLLILHYYIM